MERMLIKMFYYLNYENVKERLENLVNNSKVKIKVKKEEPLGYTDFLLPIWHYTMGNGRKHIIVTGSYHAAEIITTIFIVHLMEDLALNGGFNINEYTIDFIPIMNPEGYLITTGMQDLYLAKGKTEEEKIALAREYWRVYKEDAFNSGNAIKANNVDVLRSKKGYQALFDGVNIEKFLKDYPNLKEHVLNIIKQNDYPIGVCAAWSANGHGVDLSQNVPFNQKIEEYKYKPEAYKGLAYANIRVDRVGPIGCPTRDLEHFTFEKENLHLLNFLVKLSQKEEITAFFNYHSVMGKIYQRPIYEPGIIGLYNIDFATKTIENYISANLIKEKNEYDIIEEADPYNYINEYIRLRFGINIQVELSKMSANPIGPLADPNSFLQATLLLNIEGFKNFINNLDFIKDYTNFIRYLGITFKNLNPTIEVDVKDIYNLIDKICTNNPKLYNKLKEEYQMNGNYNSHVISNLFYLIEEDLKQEGIKL